MGASCGQTPACAQACVRACCSQMAGTASAPAWTQSWQLLPRWAASPPARPTWKPDAWLSQQTAGASAPAQPCQHRAGLHTAACVCAASSCSGRQAPVPCSAGDVLRVSGAQLEAGAPQDALAAFETAYLKLHFNGVHRSAHQIRTRLPAWPRCSAIEPLSWLPPAAGKGALLAAGCTGTRNWGPSGRRAASRPCPRCTPWGASCR